MSDEEEFDRVIGRVGLSLPDDERAALARDYRSFRPLLARLRQGCRDPETGPAGTFSLPVKGRASDGA